MFYGMNESFVPNMTGKTVSFDLQPYERGTGVIAKITPRIVKDVRVFDKERGRMSVTYETFDLEVQVINGSRHAGFSCGMPISKAKTTDGETIRIIGVSYGQLCHAVDKGATIIQARCG